MHECKKVWWTSTLLISYKGCRPQHSGQEAEKRLYSYDPRYIAIQSMVLRHHCWNEGELNSIMLLVEACYKRSQSNEQGTHDVVAFWRRQMTPPSIMKRQSGHVLDGDGTFA